jgi:hypothetical protein
MNYRRNGFMRVDAEVVGALITNSMVQCRAPAFSEPPLRITGDETRYDQRDGNDDYTQAGTYCD